MCIRDRHIAQRHGGQVQIESVVGRGSTFTLRLPATRVRLAEQAIDADDERQAA